MEEPIQNTPAGIEEVSLEYEYVNSGEQYLGQMSENYAVVHGTVQLEDPSEQVIVEKQQQPLESVDNSEQPEISANFTQYDDTSHLYSCKATREDLLNSYHLSQTRYMSIYDLCPMCLDLGQLMQVGHHDSALVYLQQHASINYEQQPAQYQEGHFVLQAAEYAGGEGHVIGGIAGMQQMNPRLTRTSSGDSSGQQVYTDDSSNGGSGAFIDVNGNYQCHTDYQNAASSYQYHTQYQQQTSYDPNQQQEPIYYATLPEGAQFGQIYVDQDGNQIIFQPAPQYHMSDENYEHYQYQTVDPNQLIHCQQQNPPNAQGQQLPQPEMEPPENTGEPSSVE